MKQLTMLSPATGKRNLIATFRLRGDHVDIEASERHKKTFYLGRLSVPGEPTPEDGKAYYDALDLQFATYSFASIETVPDDDT